MAKQEKFTLTLDFEVEKAKLREVGNILGKDMEKGLRGTKTLEYFNSIKNAISNVSKDVSGLYSSLSKPLVSKSQAKELASSIESAFKGLDSKLLSLQGNIGKTFNSTGNVAAIKQIRQLGDEIDKLTADYQAVSQLFNKSKSLGNKGELKSQLSTASKELDALNKKQGDLSKQELKQQQELKQTITDINKKLEEKAKLTEQINTIQSSNGVSSQAEMSTLISGKIDEQQGLINSTLSVQDVTTLRNALTEIREVIRDIMNISNATGPKVSADIDNIIREEKEAANQAKTFKSVLKELGIPILSLQELAGGMKRIISYSYDYVKNLDKALTEISIVSGKTRSEVMALTDTFIELSAKTGMAIDDIAQASTIFYQQGLDDEAVKKLTEYTAIFAKISNETVQVAADQITAAINGFNFSAEQAGDVIDKMSVLAAYSAADINELATAMSKGASQANMAGLSFDQYNAYLATMIETTREAPENLGTSLKTIMSRFQSIKTGENTEDDTDVNQVEKALKSVGVQLRDTEGQLRDLGDVLNDLGPKWASLDRNTQAYLGTVIAGTRQQSRFISLMQNWDRALELTAASQNSAGAATRMHQAAMEGLDASLNNLTNAWQKLISNLANGDSFKWLIDSLAAIVKWFGDGDTLLKVFTVGMVMLNTKTLLTNMSLAAQGKQLKSLDGIAIGLGTRIKTLSQNFQSLGNENSKLTANIEKEMVRVKELTAEYERLANAKGRANGAYTGGVAPVTGTGTTGETAPTTQVVIPDAGVMEKTNTNVTNVNKNTKTWSGSLKTAGKNVIGLVGNIQTALMAIGLALTVAETIRDWLTTTSDEIREKAEEAYAETQKEIDSRAQLIKSIEANAAIYDKLSKKLNKSTEEVNQLADAANALAEAAPGALIGYDAQGNPIIDTSAARADANNAKQELADYAKTQIANIGNLARADVREQAEKNWAASSAGKTTKGFSTAGKVTMGVGAAGIATALFAAGTAADATGVGLPVGVVMQVSAGLLALGAAIFGASAAVEQSGISAEELAISQKKAKEINDKYSAEMLQNMNYITDNSISDRTIDGASKDERHVLASYIGSEWLDKKRQQVYEDAFEDGKFDSDKYEEGYLKIGQDWEDVLNQVNDRVLAKAVKKIDGLMDDIGDKSYNTVEKAIEKIIKNDMGISEDDPLFETLKTAFFKAAYSGTDLGLYQVIEDLKKRRDKVKEDYGEDSDKYKSYTTAIDSAKKMSSNEVGFYDKSGILDNVGLFNMVISQYGDAIREGLSRSTEAASVRAIAYLNSVEEQANQKLEALAKEVGAKSIDEIDYDKLTDKQKVTYDKWKTLAEDASSSIEDIWNNMEISIDIPWSSLWKDFDELEKRALNTRETLAGMLSGDGIDKSAWKNFTEQLDKIDFSNFNAEQLDSYAASLDTIAGSLKVVDGQIYANADALENIASIEEAAMQASIQSAKVELINKRLELEASKAVIDAQVATLEYKIAEAEGSANAEELKTKAQEAWSNASNKMNEFFVANQGKVAEAMVRQYADAFTQIGIKFNKLQTAMAKGEINQGDIDAIDKAWKSAQKSLNFDAYNSELDKKGYNINELKGQLEAAKKASSEYGWQISNINLKLAQLDSGLWGGKNGVASGKKQKELEEYIGKLHKIYNIENRILTLEHRLGTLEAYDDIAEGSISAGFFREQIGLTNELLDQYKFLTQEQKRFTNGIQEDIKNAGFGNVFSFDKFGQIIINWEEYNKLQTTAAEGQKSLKEQADEWYEKQTEAIEKTRDDFDKYIDTLKKALDAQNKIYDAYIEMENKAADAVKEIYQKILDTKLEAIDKEKEAIEDLREAREQARKDQENAKEVSGLQTNLQRAMMDTSGASDSALLKAQLDIDEKLEDIAEDKYSKMLDDILDKLDEEKDALQDEFDQLWENMDWLFSWLDEEVMRDQDRLTELLQQTEEWNTISNAERNRIAQEWDTSFQTYMVGLEGGKTIGDVWQNILDLQNKTVEMDNVLKDKIAYVGDQVSSAVSGAISKAYNSGYSAGSSSGRGGGVKLDKVTPNGGESPKADTTNYTDTKNSDGFAFPIGAKVRSAVGALMDGYKYNKNGDLVTPPTQSGWDSNKLWTSGETMYVTRRKSYNGTNYYGMSFSKDGKPVLWANGHQIKYKNGGFADFTGPAWLDGTKNHPEAVLNALQTEHFIKFTNVLDKMFGNSSGMNTNTGTVNIDNIQFHVDSMSSPEDGEKAFNVFVSKFKEIGNQTGIKIDTFKNTL